VPSDPQTTVVTAFHQACSTEQQTLPLVLGITGASGAVLGLRILKELLRLKQPVDLVVTSGARLVMKQELGLSLEGQTEEARVSHVLSVLGLPEEETFPLLRLHNNAHIGAPPASGTYLHRGMVIAPCSMGTLSKIAHGTSDSLLLRAADVTLKEHRPLILLPRETPLSTIHLRNMLTLSEMGVRLIPPMLGFYHADFLSMDGQLRYCLGKVLDHLQLRHSLYTRWAGLPDAPAAPYESLL
jgi:flavin prenyltransferase